MIGAVVLAHEEPRRTARLASHLARSGCGVAVHFDARLSAEKLAQFDRLLSRHPNVAMVPRRRCDWGTFALVEAALDGLRLVRQRWPQVTHVCQLSGACLPTKPIATLKAHLDRHADVDFIEAVPLDSDPWVVDGLSTERFTLYHPFSWRRRKWLFDRNVSLQRALRVRRRMPRGLAPHLGSQWWCLSRATVDAILDDPQLPAYRRFFRHTWIPDESFFQTLAAKHSRARTGAPLTFARFDPQGQPYVFYDDHLDLLRQADGFFARKIWRGANALYDAFLDPALDDLPHAERDPDAIDRHFGAARNRHRSGRPGLIFHGSRAPRLRDAPRTARPYVVLDGLERVFPDLPAELGRRADVVMHGRVFHPQRVEFAQGAPAVPGNLTASLQVRDWAPHQFLSNLIWSRRDATQCLIHDFRNTAPISGLMVRDPNAIILQLSDRWILDLADLRIADEAVLAWAVRMHMAAADQTVAHAGDTRATVLRVSLADIAEGGLTTAERIAAALPEPVRDPGLFSSPVFGARLLRFLKRRAAAHPALGQLTPMVRRHEDMRRVLSRKT
ncbi:MAG: beta-1,6-N-acetylglucosaminyltransferase [Pseudomonadota bacterium]